MKRKPESDHDEREPPAAEKAAAAEPAAPAGEKAAPARLEALEKELADTRALAQQLKHQALELRADLDNQAKRFARERQVVREEIVMRLAREMIEVLDNLDLVVASLSAAERATPLAQGVELTRSVFLEKLKSFGVEPIESIGRPFDPAWHESLFETESGERPPGTILSELTRGWRLGTKVVRAAKVEIAKAPAAANSDAGGGSATRGDAEACGD
jgi:molecular chaperone GrpE